MSGIDFQIAGVIQATKSFYVILLDEANSMYFPIPCQPEHAHLIDGAMTERLPFEIGNFGLYFTFASLLKANGVTVTEAAIVVGKNKSLSSYLDAVQENELGVKVSRIPIMLTDAMVFCAIFQAPCVVYGAVGTDFAFLIDKSIPKQSIFAYICDDIAKSEKFMSMQQDAE